MDKRKTEPALPEKPAHQAIGDDKGEGGQQDIKTDSVETSTGGRKDAPTP